MGRGLARALEGTFVLASRAWGTAHPGGEEIRKNPVMAMGCWAAVVAAGLLLGGCPSRESAKAVFDLQHQVNVALVQATLAAEQDGSGLADELYDAEGRLRAACRPLQEASYRKLYGEEIDGELKRAVVTALDDCERAANEVASLLWRLDPEIAGVALASIDAAAAGLDRAMAQSSRLASGSLGPQR